MKLLLAISLLAMCGCCSVPRPNNIDRIASAHPDLIQAYATFPSLMTDVLDTIDRLESR